MDDPLFTEVRQIRAESGESGAKLPAETGTSQTATRVLRDKYSPDGWSAGATYCDDPGPAEFDRVLLRIGSPHLTKVVRACRAADHVLASYRRREQGSPFFEPEAPDTRRREVRHLPPFHP